MKETERLNWRLTTVWWVILFVGAMCLMLVVANRKTIVIADGASGEKTAKGEAADASYELILTNTASDLGVFRIPLKSGTKAEDVVVENLYLNRELRIFIDDAEPGMYRQQGISGDIKGITRAVINAQKDGVLICLQMDAVYEFQTSMEGECLQIKASRPKDIYSVIVVVDPALCPKSASDIEATNVDITKDVCSILAKQWDVADAKLYFTRLEEQVISGEECVEFVQDVQADVFIRLNLAEDEDSTRYGIVGRYNESYFMPEFGSVQLADILTRNVTIAASNKAVGLIPADSESILNSLSIPAAEVELGYLSNSKEWELLTQEEYKAKLATGVLNALREVRENGYGKRME